VRNCLTDEGGPFEVGLQERTSNRLSAAMAKSYGRERGRKRPGLTGSGVRQEEDCKETTIEVSKATPDDVKTAAWLLLRDRSLTVPVYGQGGIRHERWSELAIRRLDGTWEVCK
jgi:hypothetical protein